MADLIKTLQMMLAELPDNTTRAISPKDVRELIMSAWGNVASRDPGLSDDSANTSGQGYFDTGSMWWNTATRTAWFCWQGTPFAAVWQKIPVGFTPPPTFSIPTAQWWIKEGCSLSGTLPIGGVPVTAGDRILTWDGVHADTWGIWIANLFAWTRAIDFPAGTVFTGPAYVWIATDEEWFSGQATLMVLSPHGWGPGTNPGTWTLGVDDVSARYASPTARVGAGSNILVTPEVDSDGLTIYVVNFTGSLSPSQVPTLNATAAASGPLSAANLGSGYPVTSLGSGSLPAGVTVDPARISPGYPVSDLVGTMSPTQLPTLDTIAASSGDLSASNVSSGYPYASLSGAPAAMTTTGNGGVTKTTTNAFQTLFTITVPTGVHGNMNIINTGSNTANVRITHTDPNQGTLQQSTNVNPGTQLGTQAFDLPGGLVGTGRPPYTTITVEYQAFTAGQQTTLFCYWSVFGF